MVQRTHSSLGLPNGRALENLVSSSASSVEDHHELGLVEPYDHLTFASLPRFHSLLALRRSRSNWAGDSVTDAAMVIAMIDGGSGICEWFARGGYARLALQQNTERVGSSRTRWSWISRCE